MRDFSISIEIDASPAQVWAVMVDVERWSEWTRSITSVERLDEGPLTQGSRARIRQPGFPPALWRVTAIESGRSFTWVSGAPGVRVVARHWVEPSGQGSRASLSLRFDGVLGGLFGRLTRGVNNRYLGLEAAGLKRRSEGLPCLTNS